MSTDAATAPAKPLDEFGQMAKDKLASVIAEHNALAGRKAAANGDPQTLLESLRETYTEDAAVAKITEQIEALDNKREELHNKRDELLKPVVEKMVEEAKQGTEGLDEQLTDLAKTINAGKKYLTDLYGEAAVADLPAVQGKRRSGGGASASGEKQRRIRGFDFYVDGELSTTRNGKGETISGAAVAAKNLGVDAEVMREAFFDAAGTRESDKFPASVEFTLTVGEGDDRKTVNIVAKRVLKDEPRATETAAPPAA